MVSKRHNKRQTKRGGGFFEFFTGKKAEPVVPAVAPPVNENPSNALDNQPSNEVKSTEPVAPAPVESVKYSGDEVEGIRGNSRERSSSEFSYWPFSGGKKSKRRKSSKKAKKCRRANCKSRKHKH